MDTEEWQFYSDEQKKDVRPGTVISSQLYCMYMYVSIYI